MRIFKICLLLQAISLSIALCQVTPNINSGNPNFPFPQFKAYKGGSLTLAQKNPVGVPHAEMERRMIDAYQNICNNMTYTGEVVGGVRYIRPRNELPISHCTCVEADGYYLLAAAYMGDKTTFDGYFMWAHDRQFQKTERYIDGVINSPNYNYSPGISGAGSFGNSVNTRGGALGGNSAADGDVDLALALLVAWKQWGDMSGIIPPAPYSGGEISYKQETLKYLRTMVDTLTYAPSLPIKKYISGIIGFDGYMKGGDTWNETSIWAQPGQPGFTVLPERTGGAQNHNDYFAPAYFKAFGDVLQTETDTYWRINQYRRAEASSDWVMGQAYAQGQIPWSGWYAINGTTATITTFIRDGEDFRYGWRTILNYLWHGAPTINWNPATHQVAPGTNTYNLDMARRFTAFMKNTNASPYSNPCFNASASIPGLLIGGPSNLRNEYNPDGTGAGAFVLPMPLGPVSPSAVVTGDWDLMSQLFRQCVISFDDQGNTGTQRNATGTPQYFHEWFRFLGMIVLTGNHHNPLDFTPSANLKIYKDVNKTFAYIGDTITYSISYRNYGKNDAVAAQIRDTLDPGYTYLTGSSNKSVIKSGNVLIWNIGTVKGMNTGNVSQTKDSLTFKVIVNNSASGRICNSTSILENGVFHWKSNEYPNKITSVMERNCVDIIPIKPLSIRKSASKKLVQVGDTLSYTIVVKNNPTPFLNGGRPNVFITGAVDDFTTSQSQLNLKYRIIHGAHEPLINYRNYRISYFAFQSPIPNWGITTTVNEGSATAPTLAQQKLPIGINWNHRFILTFPNQLATTAYKLTDNRGDQSKIHEGATAPMRLIAQMNAGWVNFNALDDWSAETGITAADGGAYFPIANDWTDPIAPNRPVTKIHPDQCGTVSNTIKKQLVEEWDGYTWRRIYGDAPVSGRELNNLVIKDILPVEVNFGGFFTGTPAATQSGQVLTWPTISQLLPNDSVVYKFWVTVKNAAYFNCPSGPTPDRFINEATSKADNEPMESDTALTLVSCVAVPPPITPTTMSKRADKASYSLGDSITYTIGYKNTHGATYNKPSSMLSADWAIKVGNFNTTSTNVNTVNNSQALIVNNYAHGVNGTVSFSVTPAPSAVFGIAFRHNGNTLANGLYVTFKFNSPSVELRLWNGTTQVGAAQTLGYNPGNPVNIKAVINGSNLSIFIGDFTVPSISFSALPITTAGYFGLINGLPTSGDAHGIHAITNWNSNFDSAFNVGMTDPIPSGITFASASNASKGNCLSCLGNSSGSNIGGTVTYTNFGGPILKNDSITYIWKGIVNNCIGSSISNRAYMSMYGILPNPEAEVITSCLTATPLHWISFEVRPVGNAAQLSWYTANEINVNNFQIMRSSDDHTWHELQSIPAQNQNRNAYSIFDHNPDPLTYYKIKQVDYDGDVTYSVVRTFTKNKPTVNVFPNPFHEELNILIDGLGASDITISDATGRQVFFQSVNDKEILTSIIIKPKLSPGNYVLKINTPGGFHFYKIYKIE